MKNLFIFITLAFFSVILSKTLKTETRCVNLQNDCDFTSYCCDPYVCKDYRCAVKGTKDNQVEWAPYGPKCDWFHYCKKDYVCESHRCQIKRQNIINSIAKNIKKSKVSTVNVNGES